VKRIAPKISLLCLGVLLWCGSGAARADFDSGQSAYQHGDFATAAREYLDGAQQGDIAAQYDLALMLEAGQGVAKDDAQALRWFQAAADQGLADAQARVGNFYLEGRVVQQDFTLALKWFRMAADQGNARGQERVGYMYQVGYEVPRDAAQAAAWFRKAADQNYGDAQAELAFLYLNGNGVSKDVQQALRLYRTASENGNALAQFNLGILYMNGNGVQQDDGLAVHWFELAARHGSVPAQCNMNFMITNGRGIKADPQEALRWARMAANNNDRVCQYVMGVHYMKGDDVPQDIVVGRELFYKSAQQGYGPAGEGLAYIYEHGMGTPVNIVEAARWYRSAVMDEQVSAAVRLGKAYQTGFGGLPKNAVAAYALYQYAAAHGIDAKNELAAIAPQLDVAARAKGDALAQSVNGMDLVFAIDGYIKDGQQK